MQERADPPPKKKERKKRKKALERPAGGKCRAVGRDQSYRFAFSRRRAFVGIQDWIEHKATEKCGVGDVDSILVGSRSRASNLGSYEAFVCCIP